MAKRHKKLPPIMNTEFIPEEYIERSGRKGYLTRDFFVGTVRYRWLSNQVVKDGLIRHGMRDPIHG